LLKPKTPRANPALRLALIRQLHVWISVFVAPSLLFFAITGALQTFRIPDQKEAPVLIQKLARVHKDDVFAVKPARPKKPEGAGARDGRGGPEAGGPEKADRHGDGAKAKGGEARKPPPKPSTEVLKWFFSIVSVAIAVTTLLGLWMAVAYSRQKLVIWALLIAGAAAPILILAF
jgi:hypothetical protein